MVLYYHVSVDTIYTKLKRLCSDDEALTLLFPDYHLVFLLHPVGCTAEDMFVRLSPTCPDHQGIVDVLFTRDRLIMTSIYIEPRHRRQGIARKIIQVLKEVSDETGTVVQVNCKSPNYRLTGYRCMELKSLLVSEGFEVDHDLGEDYFLWEPRHEFEM